LSSASSGWGTICSSFFLGFSDSSLVDSDFAGWGFLDFGSLSSATVTLPKGKRTSDHPTVSSTGFPITIHAGRARRSPPRRMRFQLFVHRLRAALAELLTAREKS